jgi:hypothetical protein
VIKSKETMSNFEEIKATLKDKWLDAYETNKSWLVYLNNWVNLNQGKRPPSHAILGIMASIEPKLIDYLIPLCEMSEKGDGVVTVLGLNFDPRIELEKRAEEAALIQKAEIVPALINPDIAELEKIRQQIREENSKK